MFFCIGLRNFGKEYLLVRVAQEFRVTICVEPLRYERYRLMSLPPCFTTFPSKTFIEVRDISECRHANDAVFVIEPTALRQVHEPNHCTVVLRSLRL